MQNLAAAGRPTPQCALQEHDYIGLSDASPNKSSVMCASSSDPDTETDLNLGLGLGLGSGLKCAAESRSSETFQSNIMVSAQRSQSTKRRHSDSAISDVTSLLHDVKGMAKYVSVQTHSCLKPAIVPPWLGYSMNSSTGDSGCCNVSPATKHSDQRTVIDPEAVSKEGPPPSKDQIVGWPPVRCYRKQALAKPIEAFVKVNMDGITVGRKVDLNACSSYESLIQTLEEMFYPSYSAQGPPHVTSGRDHFSRSNTPDFVLTYEDKDGDWMLVGDVPWSMFVSSIKRLHIMRSSETTSTAPNRPV